MYFLYTSFFFFTESSYNLELKRALSNSEGHDWVLYMTVLNFDLHCFPTVLNINNVLPVYQLLIEASHNLDLKYVLPNNEDTDWFSTFSSIVLNINTRYHEYHLLYEPSYNIELKYTCDQTVKTLIWCGI